MLVGLCYYSTSSISHMMWYTEVQIFNILLLWNPSLTQFLINKKIINDILDMLSYLFIY